jgi:hypothetical protein
MIPSGSLKIAQSTAARNVPTPPGASGAQSRPRIGAAIREVLVDRGYGPAVFVGLQGDAQK